MNFMQRIAQFMAGRYGFDSLNGFMLALALAVNIANWFVWPLVPTLILYGVELILVGLVIARALSRNINMRALENRRFRSVYDPVKKWILFQVKKFKERKDYKYLKCPFCKAQLRVRNQKGEHGVRCPKCRGDFRVKI